MRPSSTFSITHMAVAGALVSPCNITLHAKDPKGVLMVLCLASSGETRTWKYQFDNSIVDLYFALATALRIMEWLGIGPLSLIVIAFLGNRSTRRQIWLFGFGLGNTLTGLLASLE